ncbi:MAG: aspartate aminotransferase family protein [Armatimonadota bacterium]|nr:aspartate aminotransferase family protein [Armatimonadota bacterium]MCX7778176.1 aspartate aminotransferase family protein [Armatimonadota bacterium]MDW8025653.1 aspartate aminotransferase family protein [Armatimonadota bacterium]
MAWRKEELRRLFLRHVCQTSSEPLGLVVERASGSFVYTVDGEAYLDFMSGIAVNNIGHTHPKVVSAIVEQAQKYLHVMVYGEYVLEPQVTLAKRLSELLPEPLDVVYFTNSGTEANEGALKVAKKFTRRSKLIAFDGSFHGDTHGSLSVTGRSVYREPFEPLLTNVTFLPFNDVDALGEIDEQTAAVIVEPIQGEGGIRIPSERFMRELRSRCDQVGALLIFDEVQTGFGRTGRMFALEHWGIVPDIITLAKALGGGMPIGAFVGRADVMGTLSQEPPLSHVTTFGGHPVCCAAALASLDVIIGERLWERANTVGEYIIGRLRKLKWGSNLILDVRGLGLLIGIEFAHEGAARRFVSQSLKRRLILGWTLHSERVVRVAPPLNVSDDEVEMAMDIMEKALREN